MLANQDRINDVQHLLKIMFGVVPIVAGTDKFFNVLADWGQYVNPTIEGFLPFSATTFMHLAGIIEIAAGLVVLSRLTTLGAYVVSAWLAVIGLSLITSGKYLDIAVRDLVMSAAAYSLAVLSESAEERRTLNSKHTNAETLNA
jgi:uncharacterized membrane protein YphA (DoxX/SURF4 family)